MTKTIEERKQLRIDHPDSWIATEPGDAIMGTVVDVQDAWSDQRRDPNTNKPGSSYPLLTISVEEATGYDPGKELKVHAFGAVLFNEIMRKQPGIGERIRIVYQGPGKAKVGQNAPELYVVRAASNTDVARRAYASIGGASKAGATEPPVGAEDFVQGQLPADDDIPF